MSLRRVFVDVVSAGKASVGGERAHHLARVARLREDERVEVTDHERLYEARVAAVGPKSVEFAIEAEIEPPAHLDQAVSRIESSARFILHREANPLSNALEEAASDSTREIVLSVGPEGGWSDRERVAAQGHGFMAVGLGANILRTETAAVAALAVVTGTLAPARQP